MKPKEDFVVYQKAYKLALDVSKKIKNFDNVYLRDQIFKSITSVPANFAEMNGYRSQKYSLAKLRIMLAENAEVEFWFDFAKDIGYFSKKETIEFKERNSEVGKMAVGLLRTIKKDIENPRNIIKEKNGIV
ncbi:MAG: four helix bundle protein [Nanobdellota archaeon]